MHFVLSSSFCTVEHLTELAICADNNNWWGMSFSDHVVHPNKIITPYPYTKDGSRRWEAFTDWPDPMVMTGALAAITKNLHFTNNIFVLPMRNPFLVAKAAATAAIISNNRFTLSIGVGWSKDEFELLQQDFHTRGKRTDEMITVMKKLWSGEWVSHDGEFYPFAELEANPAPTKNIPIWVGGISKAAMKRAARLGDGWVSDLQSSEEIIESIKAINHYRKEYGRDHLPFNVMATPNDAFTIESYKHLEKNGVTHILTQPWAFYHGNTTDIEKQKDGIAQFAKDIINAQ